MESKKLDKSDSNQKTSQNESQPPKRKMPVVEDFQVLKPISKGAFGIVYIGCRRDKPERLYAIKVVKKSDIVHKNMVHQMITERDTLAHIRSPFCVQLYYSLQDSTKVYLVMDYLIGGDLKSLVLYAYLDQDIAAFYIAELALALDYLHRHGIVHRDVKPDNLLLDNKGHLKLTDFGLSKIILASEEQLEKLTNFTPSMASRASHYARTPGQILSLTSHLSFNSSVSSPAPATPCSEQHTTVLAARPSASEDTTTAGQLADTPVTAIRDRDKSHLKRHFFSTPVSGAPASAPQETQTSSTPTAGQDSFVCSSSVTQMAARRRPVDLGESPIVATGKHQCSATGARPQAGRPGAECSPQLATPTEKVVPSGQSVDSAPQFQLFSRPSSVGCALEESRLDPADHSSANVSENILGDKRSPCENTIMKLEKSISAKENVDPSSGMLNESKDFRRKIGNFSYHAEKSSADGEEMNPKYAQTEPEVMSTNEHSLCAVPNSRSRELPSSVEGAKPLMAALSTVDNGAGEQTGQLGVASTEEELMRAADVAVGPPKIHPRLRALSKLTDHVSPVSRAAGFGNSDTSSHIATSSPILQNKFLQKLREGGRVKTSSPIPGIGPTESGSSLSSSRASQRTGDSGIAVSATDGNPHFNSNLFKDMSTIERKDFPEESYVSLAGTDIQPASVQTELGVDGKRSVVNEDSVPILQGGENEMKAVPDLKEKSFEAPELFGPTKENFKTELSTSRGQKRSFSTVQSPKKTNSPHKKMYGLRHGESSSSPPLGTSQPEESNQTHQQSVDAAMDSIHALPHGAQNPNTDQKHHETVSASLRKKKPAFGTGLTDVFKRTNLDTLPTSCSLSDNIPMAFAIKTEMQGSSSGIARTEGACESILQTPSSHRSVQQSTRAKVLSMTPEAVPMEVQTSADEPMQSEDFGALLSSLTPCKSTDRDAASIEDLSCQKEGAAGATTPVARPLRFGRVRSWSKLLSHEEAPCSTAPATDHQGSSSPPAGAGDGPQAAASPGTSAAAVVAEDDDDVFSADTDGGLVAQQEKCKAPEDQEVARWYSESDLPFNLTSAPQQPGLSSASHLHASNTADVTVVPAKVNTSSATGTSQQFLSFHTPARTTADGELPRTPPCFTGGPTPRRPPKSVRRGRAPKDIPPGEIKPEERILGTPDYLAPEILLRLPHGPKVDWWAVGVCLFEFLTGLPPFNDENPKLIFHNILNRDIMWPSNHEGLTPEAMVAIDRLLTYEPEQRATLRDLQKMAMFSHIKWENLHEQPAPFVPQVENALDTFYFSARNKFQGLDMAVLEDFN